MTVQPNDNALAMMKFGVGQPVPRKEDPKLLRGEGGYADDFNLPGQAQMWMVRSPVAHGVLKSVDVSAAKGMPGVLAVYTADDLEKHGVGTAKAARAINNRDGSPMNSVARPTLARGRVRYAGEPIAAVVAETVWQAKDAAEAVICDIESLPAITSMDAALAEGAPVLHDAIPGNLVVDFQYGDSERVAGAFAAAAHVTRLYLRSNRIVVNAIEPRSVLASYEPDAGRYTLRAPSQGVFGPRNSIADEILKVPHDKVHVVAANVGGSFGMKGGVYPENIVALMAARDLGRPIKWTDERSGSFLSDTHGRDHQMQAELALDQEGHILALRLTGAGNGGAYPGVPLQFTTNAVKNVIGVYNTPLMEVQTKGVVTNTTPIGAYRGAGRPEGNYYMERLMDQAAHEMGIDRVEIRRRNHIKPEQMPYKAPSGMLYDSGDFTGLLDQAVTQHDVAGYDARRAESAKRGKLRGIGIGQFLEVTAPNGKEMGGIRFEEDGSVTIITGTFDYGQGHGSPFAQVLTDQLGIPFDKINLLQGDSDQLIYGGGSGGSRSIMLSGAAIMEASAKVVENGTKLAAHVLEAAEQDIRFADGRFTIAGTDRSIGIMELAEKLRSGGVKLPGDGPVNLDASLITAEAIPSAFPNGAHICEVEIDPDTGVIAVVRYSMVNDFGIEVNPMLVAGQAHGGVVQAVGQAILEHVVYDEEGQLLTGSFMDYAMPRADDVCSFTVGSHPVPAKTNPLGAKGCGEAGCAGGLPSVMNAVVDALRPLGIAHIDMPCTPQAVWAAIQAAKAKKAA